MLSIPKAMQSDLAAPGRPVPPHSPAVGVSPPAVSQTWHEPVPRPSQRPRLAASVIALVVLVGIGVRIAATSEQAARQTTSTEAGAVGSGDGSAARAAQGQRAGQGADVGEVTAPSGSDSRQAQAPAHDVQRPGAARGEPAQATTPVLRARIGEGTFVVGVDVRPGIYRTGGGVDTCSWTRLHGGSTDIIENSLGSGQQVVTLKAGERFETSGCDMWYRQQR